MKEADTDTIRKNVTELIRRVRLWQRFSVGYDRHGDHDIFHITVMDWDGTRKEQAWVMDGATEQGTYIPVDAIIEEMNRQGKLGDIQPQIIT